MVVRSLLVHFNGLMITLDNVDVENYKLVDMFLAVRSAFALKKGLQFPRYVGFRWHPPGKEGQRWPLLFPEDWTLMVRNWLKVKTNCIPIYIDELRVATCLQLEAEALEKKNLVGERSSNVEDPIPSEIGEWVDTLIVTPCVEASQGGTNVSTTRAKSPLGRPKKLPVHKSKSGPSSQPTITQTQMQVFNPTHQVSEVYDGGDIVGTELQGLDKFDIHLCQPEIDECDVFHSDDEANGGVTLTAVTDDEYNDDEFIASGDEPSSDDESLDESDVGEEEESLEDIDLEDEVEEHMSLGHDDPADDDLVVGKMAKVYRQGSLWSKGREEKISLKVGDLFTCKEQFLSVMRDYCVEHGIQL